MIIPIHGECLSFFLATQRPKLHFSPGACSPPFEAEPTDKIKISNTHFRRSQWLPGSVKLAPEWHWSYRHQGTGRKWNSFWKWMMAMVSASSNFPGTNCHWANSTPNIQSCCGGPCRLWSEIGYDGNQFCWEILGADVTCTALDLTLWSSGGELSFCCPQLKSPTTPSLTDERNDAEKVKWLAQDHGC